MLVDLYTVLIWAICIVFGTVFFGAVGLLLANLFGQTRD